jgi:hypothetical protein
MTLEEIKKRLETLSKKQEFEGNYVNANICSEALALISSLEESSYEAINFMDHALNQGNDQLRQHREHARKMVLTSINFGHSTNDRGEIS